MRAPAVKLSWRDGEWRRTQVEVWAEEPLHIVVDLANGRKHYPVDDFEILAFYMYHVDVKMTGSLQEHYLVQARLTDTVVPMRPPGSILKGTPRVIDHNTSEIYPDLIRVLGQTPDH